jgi:hypothetical protein
MYGVSAVVAGIMLFFNLGRWWRLFLFMPLSLGGYGVFQAREKT